MDLSQVTVCRKSAQLCPPIWSSLGAHMESGSLWHSFYSLCNRVQWILCKPKIPVTEDSNYCVVLTCVLILCVLQCYECQIVHFFNTWGGNTMKKHPYHVQTIHPSVRTLTVCKWWVSSTDKFHHSLLLFSAFWYLSLWDMLWLLSNHSFQWWKLKTSLNRSEDGCIHFALRGCI